MSLVNEISGCPKRNIESLPRRIKIYWTNDYKKVHLFFLIVIYNICFVVIAIAIPVIIIGARLTVIRFVALASRL